jgi:hypothetical protein
VGEQRYAFILNRENLLFYVRSTGLKRVRGELGAPASRLASAKENSRAEWTVRITIEEAAERLNSFLFSESIAAETGGI